MRTRGFLAVSQGQDDHDRFIVSDEPPAERRSACLLQLERRLYVAAALLSALTPDEAKPHLKASSALRLMTERPEASLEAREEKSFGLFPENVCPQEAELMLREKEVVVFTSADIRLHDNTLIQAVGGEQEVATVTSQPPVHAAGGVSSSRV